MIVMCAIVKVFTNATSAMVAGKVTTLIAEFLFGLRVQVQFRDSQQLL